MGFLPLPGGGPGQISSARVHPLVVFNICDRWGGACSEWRAPPVGLIRVQDLQWAGGGFLQLGSDARKSLFWRRHELCRECDVGATPTPPTAARSERTSSLFHRFFSHHPACMVYAAPSHLLLSSSNKRERARIYVCGVHQHTRVVLCGGFPRCGFIRRQEGQDRVIGTLLGSVGRAVQARPRLESAWFQKFNLMKRNLLST